VSIKSDRELAHLQAIGRIVRKALDKMAAAVRPGIVTAELNDIGSRVLTAEGARSAPPSVYGFPGDVCISVNEEAIHGIPGKRLLCEGDLVKLDLVAERTGSTPMLP
jgi:methionyl aminopeptidase